MEHKFNSNKSNYPNIGQKDAEELAVSVAELVVQRFPNLTRQDAMNLIAGLGFILPVHLVGMHIEDFDSEEDAAISQQAMVGVSISAQIRLARHNGMEHVADKIISRQMDDLVKRNLAEKLMFNGKVKH